MLRIYNTLTRKIEPFETLQKKTARIYTCGPSVYQRSHLGNFRTFLFEDILVRYLEYKDYDVKRVLNFTDVEDKSIEAAKSLKSPLRKLTEKYILIFLSDAKTLHMKNPTFTPRSSTSVSEAADLIKILLKKGYAYRHGSDIYFDPLKFKNFGKLSRIDMKSWPKRKRRFHLDDYPGTPWNRGDFIIWRGYKRGDPIYWDTPLGRGRPAWNVQDAAMATKYLGFEFDALCGGIDNLVRHHDYTIALTESVSGKNLARYWLHCKHLLVGERKMSKSLGNVLYIDDLTRGSFTAEQVRFYLIYGHYRKSLNFSQKNFRKTVKKLEDFNKIVGLIVRSKKFAKNEKSRVKALLDQMVRDFEIDMDNDLSVKKAFDNIHKKVLRFNKLMSDDKVTRGDKMRFLSLLKKINSVLQVLRL